MDKDIVTNMRSDLESEAGTQCLQRAHSHLFCGGFENPDTGFVTGQLSKVSIHSANCAHSKAVICGQDDA